MTSDPLCDSLQDDSEELLSDQPKKKPFGNSTKKGLTDIDALVAHQLKENNCRTIDIALMMDVSERTVTRLFLKAKTLDTEKENPEVDKIVSKFLEEQDKYRGATKPRNKSPKAGVSTRRTAVVDDETDDSKRQTGMRLLAMNVKVIITNSLT